MQLLLGTRIAVICFSDAFHFSVLRMHNSALVAEESELLWDSILFLLDILKNEVQNDKNISIYVEDVTLFAKYAMQKKKEFKLILFVLCHRMTCYMV